MITVCCRFAHSFKIMCMPQPGIPEVVPLSPVQALCSGRGGEIKVEYIRCIEVREPEAFELWAFAEDGICKVHPYARVQICDKCLGEFLLPFFQCTRNPNSFLGSQIRQRKCLISRCSPSIWWNWNCYPGLDWKHLCLRLGYQSYCDPKSSYQAVYNFLECSYQPPRFSMTSQ